MSEHMHSRNHEYLEVDEQISLQAVSESEATDLFKITVSNRAYLAEFLPWAQEVTIEADSLEFIRHIQIDRKEGSQYGFGIYYEGQLVGHTSLMHLTDRKRPEIGYWIAKDHSGKGITTRATQALERFGFETLGLGEIVIRAREDNLASNAIPNKLGYLLFEVDNEDGVVTNVWRKTNEK